MITQQDVTELKRRFTPEECTITRFAGAYVDAHKNIVTSFNKNFLNLEDAELHKYLKIIREIYSNELENKLLTLEFNPYDIGETFGYIQRLVNDGLKDEDSVEGLMLEIINDYITEGNYLILLFHDNYDVIKQASDGAELDSEEVYSYIQCIICPVNLEKGGLQYRKDDNAIGTIDRDWIVGKPRVGFVYPAFEHRTTEAGHIMYYTQKPLEPASELITKTLQCKNKYTIAQVQKSLENTFFKATKSEELTEEYLQRLNVELRNIAEQERTDEVITAGDLAEMLEVIHIPANYAAEIVKEYKSFWQQEWPKVHWMYDPKRADAYHAQAKKNKGRELLSKASRALLSIGPSELAEDIEKYLESTR